MKIQTLAKLLVGVLPIVGITSCSDDAPIYIIDGSDTAADTSGDDTATDTPSEDVSTDTPAADVAEDTAEDTADVAEDTADVAEDTADVAEDTADVAEDTADVAEDTADVAEDTADVAEDTAEDSFVFSTLSPDEYTRVDRMGMPAVATALISSKDAYNAANPTDDVSGVFVPELVASVAILHAALDDDLVSVGLTPCTEPGDGSGSCVAQIAPLIVPDVLQIDTAGPAGFPNGRTLEDPVMDITLAIILLDLSVHSAFDLVGLLNPAANDVPFSSEFPYLAPPH